MACGLSELCIRRVYGESERRLLGRGPDWPVFGQELAKADIRMQLSEACKRGHSRHSSPNPCPVKAARRFPGCRHRGRPRVGQRCRSQATCRMTDLGKSRQRVFPNNKRWVDSFWHPLDRLRNSRSPAQHSSCGTSSLLTHLWALAAVRIDRNFRSDLSWIKVRPMLLLKPISA